MIGHQLNRCTTNFTAKFATNSGRGSSTTVLLDSDPLAADLGIARLTVNLAFSKLHAEGYLQSKVRSGTFVADSLPEFFLSARRSEAHPQTERRVHVSDRVRKLPDQRVGKEFDLGAPNAGPGVSLTPSIPAVDEFPIEQGGPPLETHCHPKGKLM